MSGHDLLHVRRADGELLGWADPRTGARHPSSPAHVTALAHALADWSGTPAALVASSTPGSLTASTANHPCAPSTVQPAPSLGGRRSSPVAPWTDLAANVPGAELRAQAVALRQQAPVRTFLDRLRGRHTEERAWRIGADGEEIVGAALARLVRVDPRWRVLHAIPVGVRGSDIDHLVLGPGGAFTLNTKHHPDKALWVGGDTFLVNGSRQPYIRNSRHEAARAARLLGAACGATLGVSGVIVPVRARSVTVRTAPADVAVVPVRRLVAWLRARPPVLDEQAVAAVFAQARRSTTWQPPRLASRGPRPVEVRLPQASPPGPPAQARPGPRGPVPVPAGRRPAR